MCVRNDGLVTTEAIRYLLSGFHEDWTDDFGSWQELVDDFVACEPARARQTAEDLRFILIVNDEDGLRRVSDESNMPWDFAGMAGSYTAWFTGLLERIEQQLAQQP